MPVISRLVSLLLRVGELAFAAVVAGVIGAYLHSFQSSHTWPQGRFIYIEVLAGVSILLALLWLLPFAGGFIHWPVDLLIAAAWLAAFILLVNSIHSDHCAGHLFVWGETKSTCGRYRAGEAFAFLSMIFWFVSTLVGIWFVHRARKDGAVAGGPGTHIRRRGWFNRSRI